MTCLVYVAHPIDAAAANRTEIGHLVDSLMMSLQNFDVLAYVPGRAWLGKPHTSDIGVEFTNREALRQCDFLVAIMPKHIPTIGTVLEIKEAVDAGKKVFIYRDGLSFTLASMGLNVHQFSSFGALVNGVKAWVPTVVKRKVEPVNTWHSRPVDMSKTVIVQGELPKQAYPEDAGYDLAYHGDEPLDLQPDEVVDVPTSSVMQFPPNVWGLIVGRSSSFRHRGLLVNVSVIDPGFRGSLFAVVRNVSNSLVTIQPGERIAQIVPLPALAPTYEVLPGVVSPTTRGQQGFGSSGR